MTEATQKASITKDKELEITTKYSISYIRVSTKKQIEIKTGKRGGRYTEDTTEEGRPYRRYF